MASENGARRSAALYSVISTAQANGLDVEKYLTELFKQPGGDNRLAVELVKISLVEKLMIFSTRLFY